MSPFINPPNPVPNTKNAAKSPGQVFFKNTPMASSFPLFSLSENQSINFIKVLPKNTFQIKSHILSHRLLTGFNILSTTPPSFLKGFFSNFSSFFFLFLSSSFNLSLLDSFFFNLFSSFNVSRIESIPLSMSSKFC